MAHIGVNNQDPGRREIATRRTWQSLSSSTTWAPLFARFICNELQERQSFELFVLCAARITDARSARILVLWRRRCFYYKYTPAEQYSAALIQNLSKQWVIYHHFLSLPVFAALYLATRSLVCKHLFFCELLIF